MEYIDQIITTTIQSFDFGFCISINVLTYIIIKLIEDALKINIGTWIKRLFMLISVIIISLIYYFTGSNIRLIINSSILAPVFWSWIAKPIIDKIGFGYNNKHR